MGNIDNKCVPFNNTLSGNTRYSNRLKGSGREWIANKQSQYGRTCEDVTVGCGESTLNTLKTVSKENCSVTGLNIIKLNPTIATTTTTTTTTAYSAAQLCSSRTAAKSGRMTEDEKTETTEQSLVLAAAFEKLTDCTENSTNTIEGLVSFPDSQVTIRNDHIGPVILAFTNNYKKPVAWALKTNAIKRLVAFPTIGIIPPSETVQIKIDLIGQIPKKNSKDRLSLEYFVTDRKIVNDGNCYNFFHCSESTRMKKCLEVIYVQ
ncbi:MSP (Major sperm protein) domain family protein [Acanthocheilonema viteae]